MDQRAVVAPNRLRESRSAAGFSMEEAARRAGLDLAAYRELEAGYLLPTPDELTAVARALDEAEENLYRLTYRQIVGTRAPAPADYATRFANDRDIGRLLIAKDEVNWLDKRPEGRRAEAFINLSCSTQQTPNLLQDTVSSLQALGVDFVALAGPSACCGKPYRADGRREKGERMSLSTIEYARELGATAHVNWCTACQQTNTIAAARRTAERGVEHPIREVQMLSFLVERIEQLGDRVPWKREVRRRVLAEGHAWSHVHSAAHDAVVRLLELIPGVEVVGRYDGFSPESPCAEFGREESWPRIEAPRTAEAVEARRALLADVVRVRGADTVSCQHQGCHARWVRYEGEGLAVRYPISLLADALGVGHPDRYAAAAQIGDPQALVERMRPIWTSWGLSEDRAHSLAKQITDPIYGDRVRQCSCGRERCGDEALLTIEELGAPPAPR